MRAIKAAWTTCVLDRVASSRMETERWLCAAWAGKTTEVPVGRTHLAITVELVSGGHAGNLWPRPGRIMIASRTTTFEQLAKAIDDAFARWDRAHLHEFTLTDGTPVSPASTWDGDEPEGTLDGSKTRLGRLRLGEQFAYVFDLGDNWQHLCTVAPRLTDPVEALGLAK